MDTVPLHIHVAYKPMRQDTAWRIHADSVLEPMIIYHRLVIAIKLWWPEPLFQLALLMIIVLKMTLHLFKFRSIDILTTWHRSAFRITGLRPLWGESICRKGAIVLNLLFGQQYGCRWLEGPLRSSDVIAMLMVIQHSKYIMYTHKPYVSTKIEHNHALQKMVKSSFFSIII